MSKHTPAPWVIYDETNVWPGIEAPGFSIIVFGMDDERDFGGVRGRTTEEAMANACLIAVAPDLLSALENCPLPSSMGSAAEHYQRFYDWYQSVAVPAIRKAGGLA